MRTLTLLVLVVALASCGRLGDSFGDSFGGGSTRSKRADRMPFKTRLSTGEDKRDMVISADGNGAGIAQVRESVRHAATRHCLLTFGNSGTAWAMDAAGNDWAYTTDGDALIFRGRCTE